MPEKMEAASNARSTAGMYYCGSDLTAITLAFSFAVRLGGKGKT